MEHWLGWLLLSSKTVGVAPTGFLAFTEPIIETCKHVWFVWWDEDQPPSTMGKQPMLRNPKLSKTDLVLISASCNIYICVCVFVYIGVSIYLYSLYIYIYMYLHFLEAVYIYIHIYLHIGTSLYTPHPTRLIHSSSILLSLSFLSSCCTDPGWRFTNINCVFSFRLT